MSCMSYTRSRVFSVLIYCVFEIGRSTIHLQPSSAVKRGEEVGGAEEELGCSYLSLGRYWPGLETADKWCLGATQS